MIYSFVNIEHWICNIVGKLMKETFQLHVNDVMNVKLLYFFIYMDVKKIQIKNLFYHKNLDDKNLLTTL